MKKQKHNKNTSNEPEVFSCCGTVCNRDKAVQEYMTMKNQLTRASKDMVALIVCVYLSAMQMEQDEELDETILDNENDLVEAVMDTDFKVHLTKDQIVAEVSKLVQTIKTGGTLK